MRACAFTCRRIYGRACPPNHNLVFDGADYLSQPFVVSGDITGITNASIGDKHWLKRIGGVRRKGGTHQHNLYAIFPPEKFATFHPEIYPIYDGKRYIPKNANDQTWQADFTEPATLEAAEASITDYFQNNADASYIALSINDSNRWSESERKQGRSSPTFKAKDPQGNYHARGDQRYLLAIHESTGGLDAGKVSWQTTYWLRLWPDQRRADFSAGG